MTSLSDFTGLITSEHQDKPKFVSTVALSVQGYVDQMNLCSIAASLYDLDNAVGSQLDAVGLWVGVSRYVAISVGQWFSWDISGVGWDQGVWWEVGDAESVVTKLVDAQYRTLIKTKIACNQWDGTLPTATEIIRSMVSADGCTVSVTEAEMSVTFAIDGTPSLVTKAIIQGGYIPLKPVGVSVSFTFSS
ncbi:DUF2612 domain-containing protein [Acetobacter senegalensis]|uniref:DUF2612 domain-containing protein n=1 Tax=Acetobacter senegalensis TaxID=446692 RepID=UPI001EDAA92B|nr:DUF2612 domain-containing protein [Acetobacter senegalensis]MCG4261393.1 DUF2612 domain-containing protein [Acetobacter senegalensis]